MRKTHAYCRILHQDTGGVPSSECIIWGVEKVFEYMEMVQEAEGIKVGGLGNRKVKRQEVPCQELGVRYPFSLTPPNCWGGIEGKYPPNITPGI